MMQTWATTRIRKKADSSFTKMSLLCRRRRQQLSCFENCGKSDGTKCTLSLGKMEDPRARAGLYIRILERICIHEISFRAWTWERDLGNGVSLSSTTRKQPVCLSVCLFRVFSRLDGLSRTWWKSMSFKQDYWLFLFISLKKNEWKQSRNVAIWNWNPHQQKEKRNEKKIERLVHAVYIRSSPNWFWQVLKINYNFATSPLFSEHLLIHMCIFDTDRQTHIVHVRTTHAYNCRRERFLHYPPPSVSEGDRAQTVLALMQNKIYL